MFLFGELWFSNYNTDYFIFSNSTHFNSAGRFGIDREESYDSMFIYQRFEYSYGILNSETEGVTMFDTSRLKDKNPSRYVSYGKWHYRPLVYHGIYTVFRLPEMEGHAINNAPAPKVNRQSAMDSLIRWRTQYDNDPQASLKFIKENNGLGIFVNGIELRVKVYQKGKIKRITFYFPFRHGEC